MIDPSTGTSPIWQRIFLLILGLFIIEEILWFVSKSVVKIIRWHLDSFWVWYQETCWLPGRSHYAQDGEYVLKGVRMFRMRGPDNHLLEVLTPFDEHQSDQTHLDLNSENGLVHSHTISKNNVIFYIHGGGWVATNSTLMVHSMAVFARRGYSVVCVNYPKSPENRFPTALLCILRTLHWLRSTVGIETVLMFGESAGANLATLAAALLENPKLLAELGLDVKEPIKSWSFPRVTGVISIYGILDQHAWKCRLPSISFIENFILVLVLSFCFYCYKCRQTKATFQNRLTLLDVCQDLETYPKLLLVAGNYDPLVLSSRRAYDELTARGFHSQLLTYDARHAFFGLPPQWTFGSWKKTAYPALEEICNFLNTCSSQPIQQAPSVQ